MKKIFAIIVVLQLFLILQPAETTAQVIKSIVYDFDGFDAGAQNLPEGDYSYGDLVYTCTSQPLAASNVLGDRALKLHLNWSAGYGAFGRGISRFIELNPAQDRINFYFYNPVSNNQSAELVLSIADDDNQNHTYEGASDDNWKTNLSIAGSSAWQLISVPLSDFTDSNAGGNGVFDITFTQNKGMLLLLEFRFNKPAGNPINPEFFLDMIVFTEGAMPVGNNSLQLPPKFPGDHCLLGAHQQENPGEFYLIPQKFESQFTPSADKTIKYINTYMRWATNGSTTPHALPGNGYQTLLNAGYTPIITWEPSFNGFSALDPAQPRLTNIINGDYNAYIDAFADKIKTYSDTIIIRLMHEFDGDWYSWCISQNNNDPDLFIAAFRKIVDRFKAKNVNNVQWMWCPNSDYTPYRYWNWIVSAYPGDNYVDIVATDVYNAHYPANLPWWRSFRWLTSETYYYAQKYFPSKPFFICELASRERMAGESLASQTKSQWIKNMDLDLQSYFRKTRAIIFFSENKSQDWRVNSSSQALQSLNDNIWMDDYYFVQNGPLSVIGPETDKNNIYPNPAQESITISTAQEFGSFVLQICNINGQELDQRILLPGENEIKLDAYLAGIYLFQLHPLDHHKPSEVLKVVIQK